MEDLENQNEQKTVETVAPTAPADLSGSVEDTTNSVRLSDIADRHLEAHPGFDPSIHASNEDGTPKRRADGSYALKRGRKAGGASHLPAKNGGGISAPVSAPVETAPQVLQAPRIAPDEAARQSANLVINAAVWICGEEIGKPQDKAEAEGLKISFVNYYESRGVPDIPPEIGLIAALASYILPRVRAVEEKTGKVTRAIAWLKAKAGF